MRRRRATSFGSRTTRPGALHDPASALCSGIPGPWHRGRRLRAEAEGGDGGWLGRRGIEWKQATTLTLALPLRAQQASAGAAAHPSHRARVARVPRPQEGGSDGAALVGKGARRRGVQVHSLRDAGGPARRLQRAPEQDPPRGADAGRRRDGDEPAPRGGGQGYAGRFHPREGEEGCARESPAASGFQQQRAQTEGQQDRAGSCRIPRSGCAAEATN